MLALGGLDPFLYHGPQLEGQLTCALAEDVFWLGGLFSVSDFLPFPSFIFSTYHHKLFIWRSKAVVGYHLDDTSVATSLRRASQCPSLYSPRR